LDNLVQNSVALDTDHFRVPHGVRNPKSYERRLVVSDGEKIELMTAASIVVVAASSDKATRKWFITGTLILAVLCLTILAAIWLAMESFL
jgi:hypothetical protein